MKIVRQRLLVSSIILSMSLVSKTLYAADSAGISDSVTTLADNVVQQSIGLKQGWNLVGMNAELTLQELKEKIGDANLLVINGGDQVYKKSNADFLNDFKKLEPGRGYYIKVTNAKVFNFSPKPYGDQSVSLLQGWNNVNPSKDLTLAQIKTQLGSTLEVINGGDSKIYKKSNADFLNDFEKFTEPYSYMIKVSQAGTLKF